MTQSWIDSLVIYPKTRRETAVGTAWNSRRRCMWQPQARRPCYSAAEPFFYYNRKSLQNICSICSATQHLIYQPLRRGADGSRQKNICSACNTLIVNKITKRSRWSRCFATFSGKWHHRLFVTASFFPSLIYLNSAARTSTSSLWAGWTQKPSDWRRQAASKPSCSSSLQAKRHSRAHQRASQVDKNGKALSAEYLHGQQIISEPFCIHWRLRNRIRGLTAA